MSFQYILQSAITRDVPLELYIILPISIILGILIFCIVNRLKKDHLLRELGFSTPKQYEAYKRSCPLNFENKFLLSDEWAVNEYSGKVYRTDYILGVSPLINRLGQGIYQYGVVIKIKNGSTDILALN
ncbi:MAG: hypothetical protein II690_06085, partial [Ruminococcus sp.]|nr:hypothetical protein [Ruminococcus sp.]